jgi:nucleosome binding factor SPN SPT16 subunit
MSTIQEDPKKFHTEDGGWAFLNPESSEEEESDEEESEFEPGSGEDENGNDDEVFIVLHMII